MTADKFKLAYRLCLLSLLAMTIFGVLSQAVQSRWFWDMGIFVFIVMNVLALIRAVEAAADKFSH